MNTISIGIAGGTGSGKTTLTEHLKQHFGDDISVVHHDSYYNIINIRTGPLKSAANRTTTTPTLSRPI